MNVEVEGLRVHLRCGLSSDHPQVESFFEQKREELKREGMNRDLPKL